MNIEGRLVEATAEQQITDNFKKREFVLETFGLYPQLLKFQLANDKCELITGMKRDDLVNVHFNLRGKRSNKTGAVWNTLDAWKIEELTESPSSVTGAKNGFQKPTKNQVDNLLSPQPKPETVSVEAEPDDLPF
ncbi:MAG: DUF3127 domain-containing protein [Bacteroidota bacterium]